MVSTISTVGRDDDEINRMLPKKMHDALRRILPLKANVVDFESEFSQCVGLRIILFRQPPLDEQALHVRKRQCRASVWFGDMEELQFASGR